MLEKLLLSLAILATPLFTGPQQGPLKPCRVSGVDEQLLCGKLSVFENRQTRTGRKIDLNIVALPALDQRNKEAPLFDLAGGPGVASTSAALFYATDLREYRRHRDVVLVDQRGTGASNPLHCEDGEPDYLREMYPVKYVEDCRRKLDRSKYAPARIGLVETFRPVTTNRWKGRRPCCSFPDSWIRLPGLIGQH